MKKSKLSYHGRPVFYDERNQLFVEAGKSRIYLNGETVKKLESIKGKKKKKTVVDPIVKKRGIIKKKSDTKKEEREMGKK